MAKRAEEVSSTSAADIEAGPEAQNASEPKAADKTSQRKIPGNLPYLTAPGTFKRVLDGIIQAQRPDKFNADFVGSVLRITGGGARACIPILKRMNFVSSDGSPTDLYGKFKTDSGRSQAALAGLRAAFPEIFKRSEYAHLADDNKLRDLIVEVIFRSIKENLMR
jgi:hypothetical protein